jgi:hypothetical protein|tara:strand:+ start:734 stop:976 length:243 start_codon:yes stop_codon:yes gene_type:complete
MQEETRYIEQGNSVQQRRHSEIDNEEDIQLLDTVIDGQLIKGKEGGLRLDMFEHDEPDDLQCICDLPAHAQDIIMSEADI